MELKTNYIEQIISEKEMLKIEKVYLTFHDNYLLKFLFFNNKKFYRNYFLGINYNNHTTVKYKVKQNIKESLKAEIYCINYKVKLMKNNCQNA